MKKRICIYVGIMIILSLFMYKFLYMGIKYTKYEPKNICLRVAGDSNLPPYEYVDEHGIYEGFNVDIIRAVALSTGVEIRFYPMSWDEACKKLKKGEVDVIEGMKVSKKRERQYEFSKNFLENSQSMFVLMDNKDIISFRDLKYHKVAIQKGDIAISNLKNLEGIGIVFTDNQSEAIRLLINKKIDAYVGNSLTGTYIADSMAVRDKIKVVGKPLNSSKYSMAVKKGDKRTLEIINRGIQDIKSNGIYEKIYRKWFGQPVQFPTWYIKRIILAAISIVLILILISALFYKWNNVLKKAVKIQTQELNDINKTLIIKNLKIEEDRDFREIVLNKIFSGVMAINSQNVITFANKLCDEILRVDNSSLLSKSIYESPLGKIFDSLIEENKIFEKQILINKNKIFIEFIVSNLVFSDKELSQRIIVFRDITYERIMREKIQTKDKMQSLGNLVSGIAHEIRNPLTSIKMYAELIPKKFDNPEFRETVSKDIPKEIKRLNSLINDLLEYARPRKAVRETLNLLDSINGALMFLNKKIQEENIILNINIDKNSDICFDKNHLRQILINIIINAIESMDKEQREISIVTSFKNKNICLSIMDNGCGIDDDILDKIYNPFFTTKASGTGLGMFVNYQLLCENKSNSKIESTKGEGTTFIIEFNS